MRVINLGVWETRLTVKVHNLCRLSKNVIIAGHTITSALKNSQNKWLLIMLFLIYDYVGLTGATRLMMNYDDIMMMFYDSVGSDI
jgi:ABC-type cobalamin transport system ATPase subunit